MFRLPERIIHADWSTSPKKRFCVSGALCDGRYIIGPTTRVGNLETYFNAPRDYPSHHGCTLAGFDFPIGVPKAYADKAGLTSFRGALLAFGYGVWGSFYDKATLRHEINVHRPFYPRVCRKKGDTSKEHLVKALGLQSFGQLLRQCELSTASRKAACSLFWTLGSNQAGSAAISGWRDLLVPAIKEHNDNLGIWPFDGDFPELVSSRRIVIVETYPADQYARLGFSGRWSKRIQKDRVRQASMINQWVQHHQHHVVIDSALATEIDCGFGNGADGEDRFDALVGMLGMLSVVLGDRNDGAPRTPAIREIEGWIFGQQAH